MQATISKEFRFEAAHSLPNHDGKCRGMHGHSYRVVVEIEGRVSRMADASDEGMVADFDRVKKAWKTIEARLDHRVLNETIGPDLDGPSTAENIAAWILGQMGAYLDREEYRVSAVSVWETATGCATVRR